jgi:hypothetical protein
VRAPRARFGRMRARVQQARTRATREAHNNLLRFSAAVV